MKYIKEEGTAADNNDTQAVFHQLYSQTQQATKQSVSMKRPLHQKFAFISYGRIPLSLSNIRGNNNFVVGEKRWFPRMNMYKSVSVTVSVSVSFN